MREYDVLYNNRSEGWSVIFKDTFDKNWSTLASDLSESAARMMLRGAQAGEE